MCCSYQWSKSSPPANGPLVGPIPKTAGFPPMGAHAPFQPVVSPSPNAIAGWMTNPNPSLPHPAIAQGPPGLVQPPNMPDEVSFSGASHPPNVYSQEDLPKQVVRTLNQGSNVMSLDFHPVQQTILLVGTNVGDIGIWEVGSRERIAHKTFKVWDIGSCTLPLQAALMKDAAICVNRCLWSPDGNILGMETGSSAALLIRAIFQ
ncbi:hypothetical protein ZWY2020_052627 [Hordeum vulgare]|nr:hypothetical protein ZWY2020_052627 [Hordeum vulgare]